MKKINQTEAVHASLYKATMMFTEQLQGHYYKQFRGDVQDLASDFYMEFCEPKGEEKKSMLDRYDRESITGENEQHWMAYVRTVVSRALIDESRTHPWSMSSFEGMLDEYGESEKLDSKMQQDGDIDTVDFDNLKDAMSVSVRKMSPKQFMRIKSKFELMRGVLSPMCVSVLSDVLNPRIVVASTEGMLPVYRVYNDKAYAVYKGKFEEFNKQTGKPKHSIGVELTPKGLAYIKQFSNYSVNEERKEFLKKNCAK